MCIILVGAKTTMHVHTLTPIHSEMKEIGKADLSAEAKNDEVTAVLFQHLMHETHTTHDTQLLYTTVDTIVVHNCLTTVVLNC